MRQASERRFVAELLGTPLWSAGPSQAYAVGDLVLRFGDRIGLHLVADEAPAVVVERGPGVRDKCSPGVFVLRGTLNTDTQ